MLSKCLEYQTILNTIDEISNLRLTISCTEKAKMPKLYRPVSQPYGRGTLFLFFHFNLLVIRGLQAKIEKNSTAASLSKWRLKMTPFLVYRLLLDRKRAQAKIHLIT